LRACGGVDGIGALEAFEGSELLEGADDAFWVGQDGDGIGLEACAWSLPGFELAIEDNGGEGEFLFGRLNEALKKISAGLRPVRAMRPMIGGMALPKEQELGQQYFDAANILVESIK
jgi:hypothetical protein